MATVVDLEQGEPLVPGGDYEFQLTLTRNNGAVYDLTGKTVKATNRCEANPNVPVNASLEGMSVALGNLNGSPTGGPVTAAEGGITLSIGHALSALWTIVPDDPELSQGYTLQFSVVEDHWEAGQLPRFQVRKLAA